MKNAYVSRILAALGSVGLCAIGLSIIADERPAKSLLTVTSGVTTTNSENESKLPALLDAATSQACERQIKDLHDEVRIVRQDVKRLIDLLEAKSSEYKQQTGRSSERQATGPVTQEDPEFQEVWDVTLQETINIALNNSPTIRELGGATVLGEFDKTLKVACKEPVKDAGPFAIVVQNLVNDVENAYWDVWLAHRHLATAGKMRDSAQAVWKRVFELRDGGKNRQLETQARDQYFFFRSLIETELYELHRNEQRLRFLLGLAKSDGRIMRPTDEPETPQLGLAFENACAVALTKSLELTEQRRVIEQCNLKLAAARSNLPENSAADAGPALDDQRVIASLPIGHRVAMANIRHLELQLSREKKRLKDMEGNLIHNLKAAFRELNFAESLRATHSIRASAAASDAETDKRLFANGKMTLDLLLDAQRRYAQNQNDYDRATANHAKLIKDVYFRTGVLLRERGLEVVDEASGKEGEQNESSN